MSATEQPTSTGTAATIPEQAGAPAGAPSPVEAAMERMFSNGVAAVDTALIYMGDELGLYRALDRLGAVTSTGLASALDLDERYVREWLQAQAIRGWLSADSDDPRTARFALAEGSREVLVDHLSPTYLAPVGRFVAATGRVLPALVQAFRTGEGVPMAAYGSDAVDAQADLNRPMFVHQLVQEWLPGVPGLVERLSDATRPAVVADVGCGAGWSTIELAKAFPHIRVHGVDSDDASVSLARDNAADHGVGDRVRIDVWDASGPDGLGRGERYDAVLFLECLHDMPRPVEALRNAREALAEGGSVLVMDENSAETMETPGDEVQQFLGGVSVVWCLPMARTVEDSVATGTLMRPSTLRSYAEQAGFTSTSILPVEHPFFRFYHLQP